MADITDPTVVAYVNEYIRPAADLMVALNSAGDVELARWFSVISGLLSANADGDIILDGSETDGRVPLTKSDVVGFITQALAYQTQLNGGGVFDVVSKPSVNVEF